MLWPPSYSGTCISIDRDHESVAISVLHDVMVMYLNAFQEWVDCQRSNIRHYILISVNTCMYHMTIITCVTIQVF